MRRIALPSVMPKPRSSGSATTVATQEGSLPGSNSSFSGLISDSQFLCNTTFASCNNRPGAAPIEDGDRAAVNERNRKA